MPRVDDERHPGVYLNSSVMPIPGINDERTLLVLQVYHALATAAKFLFLMAEYLAATSAREAYGFALMQIDRQASPTDLECPPLS